VNKERPDFSEILIENFNFDVGRKRKMAGRSKVIQKSL
jgi:hypothetical protein